MIDRATAARVTALGAGAALTVALPLTFPADGGPTALDTAVADPVTDALSPGAAHWLVAPSNTPVVVGMWLAACAWFALRGRRWHAVTMLVVPGIAVAVNAWVLKPLWDRQLHDYLAYPSGHAVHLVAVATTFACLVTGWRTRATVAMLTLLAMASSAVGMIELGYHHLTDVLGGAAAAAALAIAGCWCAAALSARQGRR
ncbi:phosphatase PAP2 family protein [Nocardia sp. AG03]|uniref:phosphatase PAP2 family protein n=1 Tax=Nocardia sp. AG03 TaxID=3025312 RepID=UPI0024182893|nr:phosphatase PAP2 family protein [Nocardia sp. AG03]